MSNFNPVAPSLVRRLADFYELRQAAVNSVHTLEETRFELLVDTVDRMDQEVFGRVQSCGNAHELIMAAVQEVKWRKIERQRLAGLRAERAARRAAEIEAALALIAA